MLLLEFSCYFNCFLYAAPPFKPFLNNGFLAIKFISRTAKTASAVRPLIESLQQNENTINNLLSLKMASALAAKFLKVLPRQWRRAHLQPHTICNPEFHDSQVLKRTSFERAPTFDKLSERDSQQAREQLSEPFRRSCQL